MRNAADPKRIALLARELGRVVEPGTRLYLTGGATAVLEGWRDSTVDIDIRLEPDSDAAFRQISRLKEELALNVELASPLDFLPPLEGWRDRSFFRFRDGNLEVFDFDPYSQALSKLQRGFDLDLDDVHNMIRAGKVQPPKLLQLYEGIESELFRFPAVDSNNLRAAIESLGRELYDEPSSPDSSAG